MDTTLGTDLNAVIQNYIVPLGWRLLGALAVLFVGLVIVRALRLATRRLMSARHLDPTLAAYLDTSLGILLKVLLVIAVFGVLGVETTSFAALLAAAGIAIGAAWSGLLANFAAGLFLLFLRPFKVGDLVEVGGITGVVKEIGLFTTALDTADNVRASVGNNKIFADSIRNYSTNPFRRVDLTAPIAHGTGPRDVIPPLTSRIAAISNVLADPAPSVEILAFNAVGTLLAVRAYCRNDHYWQVYFDMSRTISEVIGDGGYTPRDTADVARAAQWSGQTP
jgi:small conductance mechanosensitive channel